MENIGDTNYETSTTVHVKFTSAGVLLDWSIETVNVCVLDPSGSDFTVKTTAGTV